MATLYGDVLLTALPPHRGLIVSVCFYRVADQAEPPPYDGNPPAEAATDCEQLWDQVDLNRERRDPERTIPFTIDRPTGYYYLQARVILLRLHETRVFAQAEQFFYRRRPVRVPPPGRLTLPVPWPPMPLDELDKYGTVEPDET